ncbi:MAG: RNA polymerase sigma factor [Oscillospiraceae bacterium]
MEKEQIKNLVLQARQGDKKAFGQLYSETGRAVYFNCLKLVGNEQEAQDIMQETFMTALEKLDDLKFPENFSPWVNRIAINKCKMHFRKNPAAQEDSEDIIEDIPDSELIPDDYADSEEKRRIIMDIIDRVLTDEQRQTVILFYFDMMSVAEIARIMECSEGTVTSRLSAARKKIREAVLIYEKKNDDRLHAFVPIPVLSKIFMQESAKLTLPELSVFSRLANANSNSNADSKAAANSDVVPDNKATTKTISGGKSMLSTVRSKVIAGICAAVIVGGGVTAAVAANRDSGAKTDKGGKNSVITEDDINSMSEKDIEDKLNALDSQSKEDDGTNVEVPSGEVILKPTQEILDADLRSGLIQMNDIVFKLGGYTTVDEMYQKYSDEYEFTYMDGSYEERKDYLLEYKVGASLVTAKWWEVYSVFLTPKNFDSDKRIRLFVANLTDPNGKVTLDKAYVVWAEDQKNEHSEYKTPAWLSKGFSTEMSGRILEDKENFENTNENYTVDNFKAFVESQGFTMNTEYFAKYDEYNSDNIFWHPEGTIEDDGKYCVDLKGENYSVYFAGEPTPSGLTPMFRYDFTFDKNTNKLYRTTITLVSMT